MYFLIQRFHIQLWHYALHQSLGKHIFPPMAALYNYCHLPFALWVSPLCKVRFLLSRLFSLMVSCLLSGKGPNSLIFHRHHPHSFRNGVNASYNTVVFIAYIIINSRWYQQNYA